MVNVNIFEQLVKEYYENEGFFLKENYSYGKGREADLLGINVKGLCIHIEVTERMFSSYDFKTQIEKKFYNNDIKKCYIDVFGSTKVKRVYVVWWVKNSAQLYTLRKTIKCRRKIKIISFQDILKRVSENARKQSWLFTKNKLSSIFKMYYTYIKSKKNGSEGK